MRNFDDFFNLGKLNERIVIDSKDCMSNHSERFNTSFVELNFSSLFDSVAFMIA